METRIIQVTTPPDKLGSFTPSTSSSSPLSSLTKWTVTASDPALSEAARHLRDTDVPVAFPTETVYGLGADATRSAAVKGIYAAKGRPSDNPLIVHVCDLTMLRNLLRPNNPSSATTNGESSEASNGDAKEEDSDPIPAIYHPLIQTFWPGPLTILLPNPTPSHLAPEVTAGLPTFGARMPASPLARSLISLADAPLAAPSANASTRPSPTTARHVLDDLTGRIQLILDDGEPCGVGVESTVVDGLCSPPVVLRPGGVGIDELRKLPGWEGVQKAYKDAAEGGGKSGEAAPRAPGMKYKHYSPRAKVVLYEAGYSPKGVTNEDLLEVLRAGQNRIGVINTTGWKEFGGIKVGKFAMLEACGGGGREGDDNPLCLFVKEGDFGRAGVKVLELDIWGSVKIVAKNLFAALRELDRRGADVIFVEGVPEGEGIAAAVMNRLRKAASVIRAAE